MFRQIRQPFAILILIATGLLLAGQNFSVYAQYQTPTSTPPAATVEIGAEIYNLDWNPVNQLLAVAAETGTYIYTADLVEVAHFQTKTRWASWKPDGTQLATIEVDTIADESSVIVWDYDAITQNFSQYRVITSPSFVSEHFALAIAWKPDGSALAVMWFNRPDVYFNGYYGAMRIYDLNTRLTMTPFSTETTVLPGDFMSWRSGVIRLPYQLTFVQNR